MKIPQTLSENDTQLLAAAMQLAYTQFESMTMTGPNGPELNKAKNYVSKAALSFSRGDRTNAHAYAEQAKTHYVEHKLPELSYIWEQYLKPDDLSLVSAVIDSYQQHTLLWFYQTGGSGVDMAHMPLSRIKSFILKKEETLENVMKDVRDLANSQVDPNVASTASQLHTSLLNFKKSS